MSDKTKPVITDETGVRIEERLRSANSSRRQTNELLKEQIAMMGEIRDKMGGEGVFLVEVSYDGSAFTRQSVYADIKKAYEDGKLLILKVTDTTTNRNYYCTLSRAFAAGTGYGFIFEMNYKCGLGTEDYLIINILPTGAISTSAKYAEATANNISCSVTIGGTEYTDVASALAALAALQG